jgi:hypothetical protein
MNLKNSKNLLLVVLAGLIIVGSFIFYLNHDFSFGRSDTFSNIMPGSSGTDFINSIDIQNNVLTNYFNSMYNSQISSINTKYNDGSISSEEKDKQLNAVIKNRDVTINTLNKLSNAKKDIFTGNITQKDILIRIGSMKDINSDIKSELNATLNGY